MMVHRMIGNYMPHSRLDAVLFMAVALFVWPVQDFFSKFK